MTLGLRTLWTLLTLIPLLGGCATAVLLETVRGRPPEAVDADFSVEVKEAFLDDEHGELMLLGYRDATFERETWVVRVKPTADSRLAVPWVSWHRGPEPVAPVFLPRDGASEPTPEERTACSYAGQMRRTFRSIPVYSAEPSAAGGGEAVMVRQARVHLAGREARSAEVQAVVLWRSNGGEAHRVELSFLEDLRAPRRKLGYLGLLPFSLAYDAVFVVAAIGVAPLVLATYASEAPSAEELAEGRAKRCGCLTREGGGEAYSRWPCYGI